MKKLLVIRNDKLGDFYNITRSKTYKNVFSKYPY